MSSDLCVVALAQIAPVWLDHVATLAKIAAQIDEAGRAGARLVAFGEARLPGYPFWVEHTDGDGAVTAVGGRLQLVDDDVGEALRHGLGELLGGIRC